MRSVETVRQARGAIVRLDFAHATKTVLLAMAGVMAAVAIVGLPPRRVRPNREGAAAAPS